MDLRQQLNESILGKLVNDSYLGKKVQAFSDSVFSGHLPEKDKKLEGLLWGSIRNCDQMLLNLQDEIFRITHDVVSALEEGKMTPALQHVYRSQMASVMANSRDVIEERSRYYGILMRK